MTKTWMEQRREQPSTTPIEGVLPESGMETQSEPETEVSTDEVDDSPDPYLGGDDRDEGTSGEVV